MDADIAILPAGTFQLTFRSSNLKETLSDSISIVAGAPYQLFVSVQPGNGTGGVPLIPQPQIFVLDAGNNIVPDSAAIISASLVCITTVPCLLSGDQSIMAINGVATFGNLAVDTAAHDYSMLFSTSWSRNGHATVLSQNFVITIGPASKLIISQRPLDGFGGAVLMPFPVICVADRGGNILSVTQNNFSLYKQVAVQLTSTAISSSAWLSGNTSFLLSNSCVTFTNLAINNFVGNISLSFYDNNPATIQRANISIFISLGPAARIRVIEEPSSSIAGLPFYVQPVVEVTDLGWNRVIAYHGAVNATLTSSNSSDQNIILMPNVQDLRFWVAPPAGIVGSSKLNFVSGFANFTDLRVDKAGSNYTLTFDSGFYVAISTPFDTQRGKVSKLLVLSDFIISAGGSPFPIQPTLGFTDSVGNFVSLGNDSYVIASLAFKSNLKANLLGQKLSRVHSTTAIYSDLGIDLIGNYSLNFTLQDSSIHNSIFMESLSFTVSYGRPYQLDLTAQNRSAGFFVAGGGEETLGLELRVRDLGTNIVPSSNYSAQATLWLQKNETRTFLCSGLISCASVVNSSISQEYELLTASLSIAVACTDFDYLTEYISSLEVAGENVFDNKLAVVSRGPWPHCFGSCEKTSPLLRDFDVFNVSLRGNFDISLAASSQVNVYPCDGNFLNAVITLSMTYITPLESNAVFMGNFTILNNGKRIVPLPLAIRRPGGPYEIKVSSPVLLGSYLQWIEIIIGRPAQLSISKQPAGSSGGIPLSVQPQVEVLDLGGNLVQSDNETVINASLVLASNKSLSRLFGNISVTTVAGIAIFFDLTVDRVCVCRIEFFAAAYGGVAEVISTVVSIVSGPPTRLVLIKQAISGVGGELLAPFLVCGADEGGNYNSSFWNASNLSFLGVDSKGPAGFVRVNIKQNGAVHGELKGTLQLALSAAGCAEFTDLKIDLAGSSYTLEFESNLLLKSVESLEFKIAVGNASLLQFESHIESMALAWSLIPVQPILSIRDMGGNLVAQPAYNVTAYIEPNGGWDPTSDPRLSGNRTIASQGGFVFYYDLQFLLPGVFTLCFTSPGLHNVSTMDILVQSETSNATILVGTATLRGVSISSLGLDAQIEFLRAVCSVIGIRPGTASILAIEPNNLYGFMGLQITFQVLLATQSAAVLVMERVTYLILRNALFGRGIFVNLDSLIWSPEEKLIDDWSGWWEMNIDSDTFYDVSVIHNTINGWLNAWAFGNGQSLACAGPALANRMRVTCYETSQSTFAAEFVVNNDEQASGFITQSKVLDSSNNLFIRDFALAKIHTGTEVKDLLIVACAYNGSTTVTKSTVYTITPGINNSITLQVCCFALHPNC